MAFASTFPASIGVMEFYNPPAACASKASPPLPPPQLCYTCGNGKANNVLQGEGRIGYGAATRRAYAFIGTRFEEAQLNNVASVAVGYSSGVLQPACNRTYGRYRRRR